MSKLHGVTPDLVTRRQEISLLQAFGYVVQVKLFQITPSDIVSMLSTRELNQSGIISRVHMMNRPFPCFSVPLFQNESKCETFLMKMSSACSHFMLQKPKISARWTSFLACRLNLPYSRSVSLAQREKTPKRNKERSAARLPYFSCAFSPERLEDASEKYAK